MYARKIPKDAIPSIIVRAAVEREKYTSIAADFGVSRERIRQIVMRSGGSRAGVCARCGKRALREKCGQCSRLREIGGVLECREEGCTAAPEYGRGHTSRFSGYCTKHKKHHEYYEMPGRRERHRLAVRRYLKNKIAENPSWAEYMAERQRIYVKRYLEKLAGKPLTPLPPRNPPPRSGPMDHPKMVP